MRLSGHELAVRRTIGDRPAMMVAVDLVAGLVAASDRREDRVGIRGEDAVVAGVFDHQGRLRHRGAQASMPAFEESADQFESQLSGVHTRPKPTLP